MEKTKDKKIGIIIQARIGSTRLPGKVVKKIEGKTVLEYVIERLKRVKNAKKIIVATTDNKADNALERIAQKCGVYVYRGSENNVLNRFYKAANFFEVDSIVRITADCPLIDPKIVDDTIKLYSKNNFDYVSNTHPPTFPDGMDVEVFSFKTLDKIREGAKTSEEKEHVTLYIFKNKERFKIGNLLSKNDYYDLRLTLDHKQDLTLIKEIYKNLYKKNENFGLKEIVKLFKEKPELLKINEKINSHPTSRWQKNQKKI